MACVRMLEVESCPPLPFSPSYAVVLREFPKSRAVVWYKTVADDRYAGDGLIRHSAANIRTLGPKPSMTSARAHDRFRSDPARAAD